jgi:ornithine decarboxylase
LHSADKKSPKTKKNSTKKSSELNRQDVRASSLGTVNDFVKNSLPSTPVYCIRPSIIKKAVDFFVQKFDSQKNPTEILYSVKSNPDRQVLTHLFESGIKNFDVASIVEVKLINELFGDKVKMYFMHPIKSRESIKEAYFNFGIRDFSLDSFDELHKILDTTNNPQDLGLHVRLSIPNSHSAIDLSGKFGILPTESCGIIRKIRASAKNFGICFHVGSQCMDPIEYRNAIMITKDVLDNAKVKIDVIDVGGGFPSIYPGMTPPNLQNYFHEIFDALNHLDLSNKCQIWCEPGRALVAESASLVVRVEGRKNQMLYINDGTYGGLFDAGYPGFIYHCKAIRINKKKSLSNTMSSFGFYGPTCDSLDVMKGPFYLPEDIDIGDYIEIAQLGAYSKSIRTEFNGFNLNLQIEVKDKPLESLYNSVELNAKQKNIKHLK